jgi:putative flippase GtrA
MNSLPCQLLRFAVVGLANTAIGLTAIFAAMYLFGAHPGVANAVGYGVGLGLSYGLNRAWTFRDTRSCKTSIWKYVSVVGVSYLLNLMSVLAAISLVAFNPYLAQLIGMCVYTASMFLGCRWFVFSVFPPNANLVARPVSTAR